VYSSDNNFTNIAFNTNGLPDTNNISFDVFPSPETNLLATMVEFDIPSLDTITANLNARLISQ
jgi:hypothetical protein